MLGQIIRRLVLAVPVLAVIASAAFLVVAAAPASHLRTAQPWYRQLGACLLGVARGDFGPSLTYADKSVADILMETAPVSAILCGAALALALGAGLGLG